MAIAAATLAAAAAASSCGGAAPVRISFSRQIQPILSTECASCHPSSYPYLDLRRGRAYSELVGVPTATAPSYLRVLPGRPDLSYLLIGPEDPSRRGLLTAAQRRLIATWIRQGAARN